MLIQDQVHCDELDSGILEFYSAIGVDTIHLETRGAVDVKGHEMNFLEIFHQFHLFQVPFQSVIKAFVFQVLHLEKLKIDQIVFKVIVPSVRSRNIDSPQRDWRGTA